MKALCLFLLLAAAFFAGRAAPALANEGDVPEALLVVHGLSLPEKPGYYGSAVLFKMDEKSAYFLAPSHVIPKSEEERSRILFTGLMTGKVGAPGNKHPQVVAISPGDDLAVLKVDITGLTPEAREYAARQVLPQAFRNEKITGTQSLSTGIFGVEDPKWTPVGEITINELSWSDSMEIASGLRASDMIKIKEALKNPRRKKPGTQVELRQDCPESELEECYLVKQRSWGYSGGAVYFYDEKTHRKTILGLVTHFSFLTPNTYVTPIQRAIEIGESLLQDPHAREWIRDSSGKKIFQIIDDQTVLILDGPLRGQKVTSKPALSQGGGGDNGGGGGGDNGGGGGDNGHGGALSFVDTKVLGIDLSSLQGTWGIKGIQSLLNYHPGVRMGAHEIYSIRSGDQTININSLRDFLREYEKDPNLTLLGSKPKLTVPPLLSNCQEWGTGVQIPRGFFDLLTISKAILRSPQKGKKGATWLELTNSKKVLDGKVLQFDEEEVVDLGQLDWQFLGADGLKAQTRFKSELVRKSYQWVGDENVLLKTESLPGRSGEVLLFLVPGADDERLYLKVVRTYFDDGTSRLETLAIPFEYQP